MFFNQNLIPIGSEAFQTMNQEEQKQNQNDGSDNIILLENILLEILSRLPVKILLRFMCVCKRWKSLISSRTLRKLHRERHSSSPPLILTLHSSEDMTCEPFEPGMIPVYYLTTFDLYGNVLQCRTLPIFTDSLVLLPIPPHAKLLCFSDFIGKTNYFYNPSTRKSFPFPASPSFSLPDLLKPRNHKYGYIPSKDEYIMAILCERNSPKSWVCETLTFSISGDNFQLHYNEWKSIEVTTMLKRVNSGLFVNGSFYWLVRLEGDEEDKEQSILSFDVETNVFSTFVLPQGLENNSFMLFELNDELYLTNLTLNYTTLELWKFCVNELTLYWKIDFRDIGYNSIPQEEDFDWEVNLWRLEYLNLYSSKISQEMGRLVFLPEHVNLEEDEEGKLKPLGEDIMRQLIEEHYGSVSDYFMFYTSKRIHSNLFTL